MLLLDVTIVDVALPSIERSLVERRRRHARLGGAVPSCCRACSAPGTLSAGLLIRASMIRFAAVRWIPGGADRSRRTARAIEPCDSRYRRFRVRLDEALPPARVAQ